MGSQKLTVARVRTIYARQKPGRFGPLYRAAQQATRGEAPQRSYPCPHSSERLQRDLHAMSRPETGAIALILHNPLVFEVLDQFLVSPLPTSHPMAGHPKARGLTLPTSSGTLAIAEKLGLFSSHPFTSRSRDSTGDDEHPMAIPYLGDFMIFLTDSVGPYAVDVDVKGRMGDHGQPSPGGWQQRNSPREIKKAAVRLAIVNEYMRELRIRTVRFAKSPQDTQLYENLTQLLQRHAHHVTLPPNVHADALGDFMECVRLGRPPMEVIGKFHRLGFNAAQVKLVLEQAIYVVVQLNRTAR